jgi:hypothetical protein
MLSKWGTWFSGKDWSLCNLAPLTWPSCLETKIKLRHLLFTLQNLQMGPKFPKEHVCPRQQGNIGNPYFPRVIWAHSGHFTMEFRPIVHGKSSFPVKLSPFVMGNHFFPKSFAHLSQGTMWNFEKRDRAFWNFHVGHWWLAWVLLCQILGKCVITYRPCRRVHLLKEVIAHEVVNFQSLLMENFVSFYTLLILESVMKF